MKKVDIFILSFCVCLILSVLVFIAYINNSINQQNTRILKDSQSQVSQSDGTCKVIRTGEERFSYIVVEFNNGSRLKLFGYETLAVGDHCSIKNEDDHIIIEVQK